MTQPGKKAEAFIKFLRDVGQDDLAKRVATDIVLAPYTSMLVGGSADYYIEPRGMTEVRDLMRACLASGLPYTVLGNGSNVIISDEGIEGLVIRLADVFSAIEIKWQDDRESACVHAYAGALLSRVAQRCFDASLDGMQSICGIPGSIGGAIVMNAGAYEQQIADLIDHVVYLDEQAELRTRTADDMSFAYRHSYFSGRPDIVLCVVLHLRRGNKEKMLDDARACTRKRSACQPLNFPSAGSVFKRPEGHFAGALIEKAGLKGYQIGGACVSEKHAGFIVNTGSATARDIHKLIQAIQKKVVAMSGVLLETEVVFIGKGY